MKHTKWSAGTHVRIGEDLENLFKHYIRCERKIARKNLRKAYLGEKRKIFKDFQKSTKPITKNLVVSRAIFNKVISRKDVRKKIDLEGLPDFEEEVTTIKDIVTHLFPEIT